jgi:hypothetical protein
LVLDFLEKDRAMSGLVVSHLTRLCVMVVSVVALAGCASQQDYLNKLATYEGMTERQLIETKGVPTNSYEVEGRKYLSYVTVRSDYHGEPGLYGGTGIGMGRGTMIGTGVTFGGGGYRTYSCENTFVIFKGIVEKAGYKGRCL